MCPWDVIGFEYERADADAGPCSGPVAMMGDSAGREPLRRMPDATGVDGLVLRIGPGEETVDGGEGVTAARGIGSGAVAGPGATSPKPTVLISFGWNSPFRTDVRI